MKHVIVGTAGHIDHGKSALVLALTGTDPDRLEEEKARGITIDLGFAHLDLGDDLRVGFIDVPGHERFVKNMLAGVGGIDLVLLVVAADESIKPQTREHFDICRLLDIRNGLVAITKSDLVERDILDLVRLEIQDYVTGSFLEGAPILPVSARTGAGLDALRTELRRLGLAATPKPADCPFRLPIDRVFIMKGFGAVVTGTLVAGKIEKDAEVEVFPLGRRVRVRGIEVHNSSAEVAMAGQRTALNLVGVEAKELTRGMVLAPPGVLLATNCVDCKLRLLPTARPLKNRTRVHLHCGTAEIMADVVLVEGKEMRPGEEGFAQLRLAKAGLFLPGDRFILRQLSPVITMGGGIVLDNQPAKHRLGDSRVYETLRILEHGESDARLEWLVREMGEATLSALVARTGWQQAEVLRIGKTLEEKGRALRVGEPTSLLVHREYCEEFSKRIIEELQTFHAANPLVAGLSKEELRAKAAPRGAGQVLPSPLLFNAVLQALTSQGKVDLQGEAVRLGGRRIQLTAEETAAKEQISAAFEKAGLEVPSAREVLASLRIDRARAEKLLLILLKDGTLMKVSEDLTFHRSALGKLRELLVRRKAQSNRLNVATFKDLTGLTRKYAIPLLEYLDRERVTRREGDDRIIL